MMRTMRGRHRPWLEIAALGVIVAGAVVLRFASLATNPGGLYTDEATEAVSALRLLHEPGYHPLFFPDGGGREALFAYLVAGAFALFGETTTVLRGTAAAIGVAGVVAIWWLGRRFGSMAALVAAGWAAGSLWLVCVSRDGMRNTLVPLFGALALLALLAWQQRPGRWTAILAGATVALASLYTYQPLKLLPLLAILWLAWLRQTDGDAWRRLRPTRIPATVALASLYTYQPLKLLPLLAILWLAWLRQTDGDAWRRLRPTLIPATVALLLVSAPMLWVAVSDPGAYFGRAVGVTSLNPGIAVNPVDHVLRTLGMFFVTGDPNPRHDVAGLPMLGWPVALLALAGLARIWRRRHEPADALIGIALPVFLLPPLIAVEGGAPHFLRSLGLAAPVAVVVGLGAASLGEWARTALGARGRWAFAIGLAGGLVLLAAGTATAYLGRPVADRYAAFSYNLVALAHAAGPHDAVILDDYDASVVRFLDADAPPAIVAPGTRISASNGYRQVLATSRAALAVTLGERAAGSAQVVARDPAGSPTVWAAPP
jgi:ABC-type cobalt transport system substrate-binding protein